MFYFPIPRFCAGVALIPYGLPCLRELFRFLISLTNPHDRHNTDAMIQMGLQLLTVALESTYVVNYQSLLVLVKDELCRHLFQVGKKNIHMYVFCFFFLVEITVAYFTPLDTI